ncbi:MULTISPECIES: amino acid ABC transporter permease [Oceanimonas]|uniref:Amino acid ABC transporter permease n=1 Tax=Oceanimonas doudoroffii TaxID=84158 RepID=A0A233RJN3_9GAMM|nr:MULTISPECIES: amino acid ABC transporter permease [Oceanimonas]NHH99807.1 putative glutamine ABC transporter permease protein GlnM [Oceanimonas sp. MB9]OXY83600.1 amino acid ABC transporter permease [Oceanimonas doudoroffii]
MSSPVKPSAPPVKFWRDPAKRALLFQLVLLCAVAAFIAFIVNNTLNNLSTRGITTGFGFLDDPAGFAIAQSLIPYAETDTYGRTFVVGLLNTLLVSFLGIIGATLLGFVIGVARLSPNWLIARLASAYVELFRNIPLLLQMFFWYFAVLRTLPGPRDSLSLNDSVFLNVRGLYLPEPIPGSGFIWIWPALLLALVLAFWLVRFNHRRQDATGQRLPVWSISLGLVILLPGLTFLALGAPLEWNYPELRGFNFRGGMTIIPEFLALWLSLTVYTAAFIAEIVRSGIQAISHGQTEAAHALGIKDSLTLRLVIIPQALRVIIPPLTSQYLNLTKNSSLATAIGYPDLVSVFAGTTLNQTGQAIEVIAITMLVYLSISLAVSFFMNWFNSRMALVER